MHRCLEAAEMRELFCSFADHDTLVNLACTSTLFSDLALDAHWGRHDVPFELAFSCGFSGIPELVGNSTHRPIESHECNAFLCIARRIRRLVVKSPDDWLCLDRVAVPLTPPIFTALRFLVVFRAASETKFQHLALLFGPMLTDISLSLAKVEEDDLVALCNVRWKCPTVRRFELHSFRSTEDTAKNITEILSQTVCKWQRTLEFLCCPALSKMGWSAIATSDTIKTLQLYAQMETLQPSHNVSWKDLISLTMYLRVKSWKPLLFALHEQSRLEVLSISIIDPPKPSDLLSIISQITSSHYRETLRTLVLYVPPGDFLSDGTLLNTFSFARDLDQILKLPNLVSLDLSLYPYVIVNDADIDQIARRWPLLEQISLRNAEPPFPPQATIQSLAILTEHCSKMRKLKMTFDARQAPPIHLDKPAKGKQMVGIERLWVGHSPITDPTGVAIFLSSLFPGMSSIESYGVHQGLWAQVMVCFQRFKQVREQEKRYWSGGRS